MIFTFLHVSCHFQAKKRNKKLWPKIFQVQRSKFFIRAKLFFFVIFTFQDLTRNFWPKKRKKIFFTKIFWNFNAPPNRPNSKFWNSDFARWWILPRRFISEKFSVSLGNATEWWTENLQKWPKITKFWLWPPIKLVRGKKSKFRFQHFVPNNIVNTRAKFRWAAIKTLGGDRFSVKLDAAAAGRTQSVHDLISSADHVVSGAKKPN